MNLNKLKGLRAERSYTQNDVANFMGISLTSYQRKESGTSQFTASEIIKIAEIFQVDISEIFFIHNIPKWDGTE